MASIVDPPRDSKSEPPECATCGKRQWPVIHSCTGVRQPTPPRECRQGDVVLHADRLWQYDPAGDPHYPWANITGEWDRWPVGHVPTSAVLVERNGTVMVQIHPAADSREQMAQVLLSWAKEIVNQETSRDPYNVADEILSLLGRDS